MTQVVPRTNKMLKMFEPTMLPTAISGCFFKAATMQVTNSGRLVPIATTVSPIILSEMFNICAISIAELTVKLLPQISPAIPAIIKIAVVTWLYIFIGSSSIGEFFAILNR